MIQAGSSQEAGFAVPDWYSVTVFFQQPDILKILSICLFSVHYASHAVISMLEIIPLFQ